MVYTSGAAGDFVVGLHEAEKLHDSHAAVVESESDHSALAACSERRLNRDHGARTPGWELLLQLQLWLSIFGTFLSVHKRNMQLCPLKRSVAGLCRYKRTYAVQEVLPDGF